MLTSLADSIWERFGARSRAMVAEQISLTEGERPTVAERWRAVDKLLQDRQADD